MADSAAPIINIKSWWTLRSAFQRTLPKQVTSPYLAAVLSVQESAAKTVLRNLKLLGLVGEDNEPTELANRWRNDAQYADACAEIVSHVYPDELLSAAPGPEPNTSAVAQWFQSSSHRLGSGSAGNAARTYALIASAKLNPDQGASAAKKKPTDRKNRPTPSKVEGVTENRQRRSRGTSTRNAKDKSMEAGFEMPRPQIAVQVNIAPDMTPEQIDQIFSSMAKHFYNEAGAE